MDYNILSNKNIVNRNGEQYLDLLYKSFDLDLKQTGTLIIVNKYYVARPDLISLAMYGDDDYGDIICKVNGISNPFELNENDYLFIPSLDYIRACCIPKNKSNTDFIETSDDEILAKTSNYQKRLDQKRTPNEQICGEQNFVIDKSLGVIFY